MEFIRERKLTTESSLLNYVGCVGVVGSWVENFFTGVKNIRGLKKFCVGKKAGKQKVS